MYDFVKGGDFRILSIDPGSNNCGFTVVDYDVANNVKKLIFEQTFLGKDSLVGRDVLIQQHGAKVARYQGYAEFYRELLNMFQPDIVVSEAPFSHKHVQAFRVLAELTSTFQDVTLAWNDSIDFVLITPPPVKKAMGVPGNSGDKDLMAKALASEPGLLYSQDINLASMSEHTVDSACIALWFIKNYLEV